VNFRQLASPLDHRPGFGFHHFRAYVAVDYIADLADMLLKRLAFLRDQGRVGGDAIDDSPTHAGSQFVQFCGIEKELHSAASPRVNFSLPQGGRAGIGGTLGCLKDLWEAAFG
jgi:hypothetical protein